MAAARTPGLAASSCRGDICGAAHTATAPRRALTYVYFIRCISNGLSKFLMAIAAAHTGGEAEFICFDMI